MAEPKALNTIIGWILGATALAFVLLLAGVASGALTNDPPAVNPYSSRSSDDTGDAIDTDVSKTNLSQGTTTAADQPDAAVITIEAFDFGEPVTVTG